MSEQNHSLQSPALKKEPIRRWPEGAIVYHIYPRSLQDANGDGIGDLTGITSRLDYLKSLSVNAIWLSPFYPSPMADFGYDIADYCAVDPIFGSLDDFRMLLSTAADLGIRVIIDLVPNHTSDMHPWFRASKQSMNNGYSDWYIWRNGTVDDKGTHHPPNNWLDALGGQSAWEWSEERQQYYLHSFHKKQPDLNWANPNVREAMKSVMRFWLDLGVDGFRVDAVYWMAKDPLLRDDSPSDDYVDGEDSPYDALTHDNSCGWPAVYSHLNELASVLKEAQYADKDRFMVTEAYPERHNPVASYMAFYEGVDPKVAAPFNFEGVSLPWRAQEWHRFLKSFHEALNEESPLCIASYAFGNHDKLRLAGRIGENATRSAAVMLLSLPGMVFIYYGEEIGMVDVNIPADRVQDPGAVGDPKCGQGRDPARTPMQWSSGPQAGFSQAEQTWLPVAPDYAVRNVQVQSEDTTSLLNLYQQLGALRNQSDALKFGTLQLVETGNAHVLAYQRSFGNEKLLVLINFDSSVNAVQLPDSMQLAEVLINSHPQTEVVPGSAVSLKAHQALIFKM